MAGMPYPPTNLWEFLLSNKLLCKSVKSVGEHYCSRVRGYGKDTIPSYNSVETTP